MSEEEQEEEEEEEEQEKWMEKIMRLITDVSSCFYTRPGQWAPTLLTSELFIGTKE